MSVLRRTRPGHTPEPEPEAVALRIPKRPVTRPAVSEARRIVRRPGAVQSTTRNYYGEVVEELKSIAMLEAEQEELTRRRKEVEAKIEEAMRAGKLQDVDDGVFKAEYKPSMGRAVTVIDPLKFKAYLGKAREQEFWGCVSIGVTEAKTLITESEIAKVGKVIPAKVGDPKLSVSRKKKSK